MLTVIEGQACSEVLSTFAFLQTPRKAEESFVTVRLPHAISVDVPRSWNVMIGEEKKELDTLVQRTLDLSGITTLGGSLLAAKSPLHTTWAFMEVRVTFENTYTQSVTANMSQTELEAYDSYLRLVTENISKSLGEEILEWFGTKKDRLNGLTVLVTEYKRTPPPDPSTVRPSRGPVRVQVNVVPLGDKDIGLTVSYTATEAAKWQPILRHLRSSFRIGGKR